MHIFLKLQIETLFRRLLSKFLLSKLQIEKKNLRDQIEQLFDIDIIYGKFLSTNP